MKSAPLIVIARVSDYKLMSGPREVEDPGNSLSPPRMLPLHLAWISANAVLALRGDVSGPMQFYSWVWGSGMYGGERSFRPYPDYCHILFLRQEGDYLHTVADFPAYDIEIPCSRLPAILSGLKSNSDNASDVFERIVNVLLKTELETGDAIYRDSEPSAFEDSVGLTSEFYVAGRLDSFCRHFPNRFGRFAACMATANEFSGRCEAYRLAQEADSEGVEAAFVSGALARCEAQEQDTIGWLRTNHWPDPAVPLGWLATPQRHRLAMRLFASAMDPDFRAAACSAAAVMSEARDIPECETSGRARSK
ncbi:MAG: hypothetical protein ABSE57_29455 [Bryobacteraceae bacterium]|jgi:hypothetical protein